jgi:hypothetical protein
MQVEAIYDHGRLELPANLRLKHAVVNVVVIVPDDEILADSPGGYDQTAASHCPHARSISERSFCTGGHHPHCHR